MAVLKKVMFGLGAADEWNAPSATRMACKTDKWILRTCFPLDMWSPASSNTSICEGRLVYLPTFMTNYRFSPGWRVFFSGLIRQLITRTFPYNVCSSKRSVFDLFIMIKMIIVHSQKQLAVVEMSVYLIWFSLKCGKQSKSAIISTTATIPSEFI